MAEERIRIESDERRIVVHMQMNAVEAMDCEELEKLVRAELAQRPRDVVINCARIKFLPSLAMGSLVALRRETSANGHSFLLAALGAHIRQVLVLSRLDRLFVMVETLQEALPAPASK
jgi:anti-anti-sigma factor